MRVGYLAQDCVDISFAADTHTITSISTLGHLSSVGGGGRAFEMMEIWEQFDMILLKRKLQDWQFDGDVCLRSVFREGV